MITNHVSVSNHDAYVGFLLPMEEYKIKVHDISDSLRYLCSEATWSPASRLWLLSFLCPCPHWF